MSVLIGVIIAALGAAVILRYWDLWRAEHRRKNKSGGTMTMYQHFLNNPPMMSDGITRRTGARLYSNFWKGYDGIKPVYLVRGTFIHEAWRAGRDTKKAELKERNCGHK